MSKAEEIHYKAVMAANNQEPPKDYVISAHADHFNGFVEGFIEGYHQAEKDLELTWEDLATIEMLSDDFIKQNHTPMNGEEFYKEILKRFKNFKERKEI